MSKQICKPKTPYDIHKSLCMRPFIPRSKYEHIGPYDHYRDEYFEIYRTKCQQFISDAKTYKAANVKALTNHKPKLGEISEPLSCEKIDLSSAIVLPKDIRFMTAEEETKINNSPKTVDSLLYFEVSNKMGTALRKRHERYYNEEWNKNEKLCTYEPWFRRYLILCKFIHAVRKVILKNRLLKNLQILKTVTKDMIEIYEAQYIKLEHLSYRNIFQKFS